MCSPHITLEITAPASDTCQHPTAGLCLAPGSDGGPHLSQNPSAMEGVHRSSIVPPVFLPEADLGTLGPDTRSCRWSEMIFCRKWTWIIIIQDPLANQ